MPALKLLVVDDDPASLELMTAVFTSLKTEVHAVSDSQAAADLLNHERFDGIFLDIQMPKLNGFELGKIIRDSSWNKSTPIVIVTSLDERDTMHQSFTLGATFFLRKPLDRQKLTSLLRTVQGTFLDNRRRYTRVSMQTEVTCSLGARTLHGITWNLSQGGMLVEVEGLTQRDVPTLSFRLPATSTVIEAEASVVWAKGERQGIHFAAMNAQDQQVIRDFIVRSELSSR